MNPEIFCDTVPAFFFFLAFSSTDPLLYPYRALIRSNFSALIVDINNDCMESLVTGSSDKNIVTYKRYCTYVRLDAR